jgi:hypothetical protein
MSNDDGDRPPGNRPPDPTGSHHSEVHSKQASFHPSDPMGFNRPRQDEQRQTIPPSISIGSNNAQSNLAYSATTNEEDEIGTVKTESFGDQNLDKFADVFSQNLTKALLQHGVIGGRTTSRKEAIQLGVTGMEIGTGLEILSKPRSNSQQQTVGIFSKHMRGDTDYDRRKSKRNIVKALTDKLATPDILNVILCDIEKHNIADDCKQWQTAIRALKKVLVENDMMTIFNIPLEYDPNNVRTLVKADYTCLIDNFNNISDDMAIDWQKYITENAADVEIESDKWAHEIMMLSMTEDLKNLVMDDLSELDENAQGAITCFKFMTNHMTMRNQELVDTLHNWIRVFDIRAYDGENVLQACGQIRAVVRALQDFGLPLNMLKLILDGFAKASNAPFGTLCTNLSTITRSTVLASQLAGDDPKKQLFSILKDLEQNYRDSLTIHKWEGVGHDGATFRAQLTNDSLQAFAARHGKDFDEWVKNIDCHNCGEKGHIGRDCTKPKKSRPRGGKTFTPRQKERREPYSKPSGKSQRRTERDEKRRIFQAKLEELDNESSESESNVSDDNDNKSVGSDASGGTVAVHAARMFSSLKE